MEDAAFVDQGAIDDLIDVCTRLEPYLDGLICYASTMDEHEPNRLVYEFGNALRAVLNPMGVN